MTAMCCVLAGPALADGGIDLYATYGEVIEGETAFGLGARLDLGGVNWRFDAAANAFAEVDGISDVDEISFEDESVSIYAFDLGLRYVFKDGHTLRPYLGGGVSYLTANATSASIDAGFGAYGMAGLRYGKKPGINFMAELIYRYAEVDASSGLTDTAELDVGGLALQVGLSFVY
jgi:hypothetical protein